MNGRGQYGRAAIGRSYQILGAEPPVSVVIQSTPTWAVAIIAGGVGMALHALWGAASKKHTRASWSAPLGA